MQGERASVTSVKFCERRRQLLEHFRISNRTRSLGRDIPTIAPSDRGWNPRSILNLNHQFEPPGPIWTPVACLSLLALMFSLGHAISMTLMFPKLSTRLRSKSGIASTYREGDQPPPPRLTTGGYKNLPDICTDCK
jgi:hypothetical protein